MGFDIRKYIEENKFDLGTVKKEVGDSTFIKEQLDYLLFLVILMKLTR